MSISRGVLLIPALAAIVAATASAANAPDTSRQPAAVASRCSEATKGKFLVAKRGMADRRFAEAVILLVDYDDKGALGLIVNRRTDVTLAAAMPQLEVLRGRKDQLFVGGPVSPRQLMLLMRAASEPEGAIQVFDSVYFSPGPALLEYLLRDAGQAFRAYAGYAGWAPGQLDGEIERGDWYVADADVQSVFTNMPASVWPALIARFEGQWAMRAGAQPGC